MKAIKHSLLGCLWPLLVLLVFGLGQTLIFLYQLDKAKDNLVTQRQSELMVLSYQLQQVIEDNLAQHRWSLATRQVSLMALSAQLSNLQLIDPLGIVRISAKRAQNNRFASMQNSHFDMQRFEDVRQGLVSSAFKRIDDFTADLYLRVNFGPRADSLASRGTGVIYLSFDVRQSWSKAWQQFMHTYVQQFVISLIVLIFLLHVLAKHKLLPSVAEAAVSERT